MTASTSWVGAHSPGVPTFRERYSRLRQAESSPSFSLRNRSLQLARLLEGGSGELYRSLNSGEARSLPEAVELLAPEQRAALTRSRGDLALWTSLSQEPEPEIFYLGLLHLAAHMEGRGRAPLAGQIYAGLAGGGGLIPEAVARRATDRLAVLNGRGPWGEQLVHDLNHGLQEAGNPALWVGMAAGGIGFRLGRTWGMGRMAAWGVRGPAFPIFSGISGLTTEAGAFVFASKGVRTLQGNGGSWESPGLGQEFAGALLMLGCLRLGGLGAQGLHRAWQGGEAKTFWGQRTAAGLQNGGMVLGLAGSHFAAMELGLEPRRPWGAVLAGSGVEFFSFVLGSRVARSFLGPRLGRLEMELEIRGRRGPPVDPLLGRGFPEVIEAWAGQQAGRSPPNRGFYPEARDLMVFSNGNGPGGKGPKAPRPTAGSYFKGKVVKEREHVQLRSQEELLAWIRGERGYLREQILTAEEHMTFHLPERASLDVVRIAQELNYLEYRPQILRGRRIRVAFQEGSPPIDYIKLGNQFIVRDYSITRSRPSPNRPTVTSDRLSSRPWEQGPGRFAGLHHLPVILSGYDGFRSFLAVAKARLRRGDYGPLVLQGIRTQAKELETQTSKLGIHLPEGLHLEIWSMKNRQTFVGKRDGMNIRWKAQDSSLWDLLAPASNWPRLSVKNPLELYLRLQSLALDPQRNAQTVTEIHFETPRPHPGLKEMTHVTLHGLALQGSEIRISFSGRNSPWIFIRENNFWKAGR